MSKGIEAQGLLRITPVPKGIPLGIGTGFYLCRVAQRPEKVLWHLGIYVCVSVCLSAEPRLQARRTSLRGEGNALYPMLYRLCGLPITQTIASQH